MLTCSKPRRVNKDIDTSGRRWKGPSTDWQRWCRELTWKPPMRFSCFDDPVDPIEHGVPDYLEVIKEPMDLRTIEEKVYTFQYVTPEEVKKDFLMIVENCCRYYPKGSPEYENGLAFKDFIEKQWEECPAADDFPEPSEEPKECTSNTSEGSKSPRKRSSNEYAAPEHNPKRTKETGENQI